MRNVSVRGVAMLICAWAVAALPGCAGKGKEARQVAAPASGGGASVAGDALFLAEAPVLVPDELAPELSAMKIGRIYAAAASLDASGRVESFPPPPSKLPLPVVVAVMAPGAEAAFKADRGETVSAGVAQAVNEARSWADVAGVHFHLMPTAAMAEDLAAVLKAVRKALPGLRLSITVPSGVAPEAWKPLKGAVDELLVMAFGRRPETGDRMAPELAEAAAASFPVPFRLLFVPGGYGFPGSSAVGSPDAHRIPDSRADKLSESHALDFELHFLSTEPGSVFTFKPKVESRASDNPLAPLGGTATFQVPTLPELTQALAAAEKWKGTPLLGRVFLLDGVPEDGHVLGYRSIKALLTGEPLEPSLVLDISPGGAGPGWAEFSVVAANRSPVASDLSHENNWVSLRVEGGVFTEVRPGDFDRFSVYTSEPSGLQPGPLGRATVCRLYENFYVPGEVNVAGPIRVTGKAPRVHLSYQLAGQGGREPIQGPEVEKALVSAAPPRKPKGR